MTFAACGLTCAGHAELVRQFNRLWGATLGPQATEADGQAWLVLVEACLWSRLPPEVRDE